MNWILLTDARRKLLQWWNIVTALMLLFFLVQQTTGVIAGIGAIVWGWFFICLLPGLVLLNLSAWLRRRTDKVISPGAYRTLFWLEILYLTLIVFIFFFSRAAMNMNDYGLDVYYGQSLWILTPFNLLLITGFILLLYTREPLFKPSPAVLMELAGAKAEAAKKQGKKLRVACFEALRDNNMAEVFEQMHPWFAQHDPGGQDQLILIQGAYTNLKKEQDLQALLPDEAQIQLNKLTISLIDLINDIQA